jgi:hypothetical protein
MIPLGRLAVRNARNVPLSRGLKSLMIIGGWLMADALVEFRSQTVVLSRSFL